MNNMNILFNIIPSKQAMKFIQKQDEKNRRRLLDALDKLRKFPPVGDIKPLKQAELNGYLRLRVGSFRIIFKADPVEKVMYIKLIDNRGDVYK